MTTPEDATNNEQEKEEVDYSKLAREGINLLLNNKQNEAETLFKTYPQSIQMNAGYAFAIFTDALMSFEDDKLQLALQTLKELEKKCSSYTGWMRCMRSKMFGTEVNSQSEQLESQIILADCYVFVAMLTFLQQEITGYFKGGWMLRKAYKHYQSTYNEILGLYKEIVGDNNVPVQHQQQVVTTPEVAQKEGEEVVAESFQNAVPSNCQECLKENIETDDSVPESTPSDSPILEGPKDISPIVEDKPATTMPLKNGKGLDKNTISRLLCAVSFGYGLLQLGISLLPPSMLKLTHFLGFGGNRKNGLDNLMFARRGTDMRAPFATLALLWYHTIVRPFFALDGNNVQAGVDIAAQLIEESKTEYGSSALFLFFEGRKERLNSDIPAAIRAFQASIDNSSQREVKMMSLHEVGWCYLIHLDFDKSENTFACLRQSSRWSKSFYSYLTIISAGSKLMFQESEDIRDLRNIFQPVVKGTQLDDFLNRRYKICPLDPDVLKGLSCEFWKLLVYELLYLWNALPSCTNENLNGIISDCEVALKSGCEPMSGLCLLIEGSCLCITRRANEGIEKFRECLVQRKDLPVNSDSAHISAFANYELGLLLIKNEQTLAEGKKFLQQSADNYKDYDFEQRLSVRVHAILKNL